MSESFDVAIVGYGPVGALTALQLAHAGHRVVILERDTAIADIPRAVGFDSDSMRACQRLGFAAEVDAVLQPPREIDEFCFTDSKRQKLFGMAFPPIGANGWRDIAYFDQPELEGLLREKVDQRDEISVRLGFDVRRIEATDAEVLVRGEDASGTAEVRASYLIGSDGASSFVRGAIGSGWESLGYDQDWLVVDITIDDEAELPLTMMQICDPERLVSYIPVRDPNRRWEFQLVDGDVREEMCRPEKIASLLESWLPPERYQVRRAAVYQFHAAIASAWRKGRILLAGDSAHQTPPFLGQGLNSGFRDAVCLGWKLPLVLSGVCGDELLDSYQAERGAHSRDLVDRAVGVGQLMETLAAREAGLPDPHASAESRAAAPDGQIIPPLRGGTLAREQIGPGSPVGRVLRQPVLRQPDGSTVHADVHLGDGFAVAARTRDDLRVGPAAKRILDRLGARLVSIEDWKVSSGVLDALFETHPAVVVRPDRLIFGAVDDTHDLDQLVKELAALLALRGE